MVKCSNIDFHKMSKTKKTRLNKSETKIKIQLIKFQKQEDLRARAKIS